MTEQIIANREANRSKKSMIIEETEANMSNPQENVEKQTKSMPVTRVIRDASERAAQIRSGLQSEHAPPDFHDEFYVDPRVIPEGWDYNWKRETTANMPDPAYEVELAQAGWEPVDVSRHPWMMPKGSQGPIRRKGMILMERPKEISEAAQQREMRVAREAVEAKERALGVTPMGQFDRLRDKTGVKKSYQPMQVPRG